MPSEGHPLHLSAFLLLAPLVTLVTTVPISVGGWGVREGAMVTALGLVNIPPSVALAVSIQFGLIMLVVGLPGGVLAFFGNQHFPIRATTLRRGNRQSDLSGQAAVRLMR